jgi:arylsulfatase
LPPLTGKSWGPLLSGQVDSVRNDQDYLAWQIFGNRAVRQGDWKVRWQYRPYGKGDWELFNVAKDPSERHDLAAQNPEKLKALLAVWDGYAKANNVIIPSRSMFETMEDQLPMRVPVEAGFPPLIYKRQFVPPKDMLADPKP